MAESIAQLSKDTFISDDNSNSNNKKVQDEDTNDSVSVQRNKSLIYQKSIHSDQKNESINGEEIINSLKSIYKPSVFDFRIGLGLKSTNSQTCRKKFQHLLPPHLSARISKNHLNLLNIVDKIDNCLKFQREMRGMKTLMFSDICKNIQQSHNNQIKINHIRQILFLDKQFYTYRFEKKKLSFDLRISTTFKETVESRRTVLRKYIFQYLNSKYQKFLQQNNLEKIIQEGYWLSSFSVDIIIPQISFPQLETTFKSLASQKSQPEPSKQLVQISLPVSFQLKRQSSMKQVLDKSKVGESFKDKLYRIVAQKQAKSKAEQEQKQRLKQKTSQTSIMQKISKQCYLRAIDEINMLYTLKNVCNMFQVNLLDNIAKRTGFLKKQIQQIVKDIVQNKSYLQEIKTDKGIILKINKTAYKQFRTYIEIKPLENTDNN